MGYLPIVALLKPVMGTKFMEKYGGKMASDNVRFNKAVFKLMEDRIALEAESEKTGFASRKDFAHYLLKSRDPQTGKGFTGDELKAESGLIVVAGADTTSTTLAAAMFYLLRNPHVMAKLAAEVRSAFSDVEEIRTGQKLGSLPYLRAVIDESLRMSPPVPGVLAREVLPGGLEVEGQKIPAGTQVGTSAYAIHHNEAYFPDAFSFKPERWIADCDSGVTEADVELARSAFCAFSLGSRGCIGKSLAYTELSITIARLLFLFEIRETPGETLGAGRPELGFGRKRRNEYQIEDRFVAARNGPIVEFKTRASPAA